MNESLHIQTRLRTLLQRFYDGTSTPEEEHEIGRLLLDPECASDEFADDRALFEALASEPAQVAPPPALGKALEEKTARHFRKAALRRRAWLRRGLAAAVAACIAGIVLLLPPSTDEMPAAGDNRLIAKVEQPTNEEATTDETVTPTDENVVVATVTTPAPARRATPRTARKAPASPAPAPETPADDIDLDEGAEMYLTPEQAARVSEAALMTLARTLASADGIYRQTNERIGSAVTTTLSRLQPDQQEPETKI